MRKTLAIAVFALLGSTAFAAGEVYRWRDANGTWHFSDQPQPGAELVKGTGYPSSSSATPAPPPAQAAPAETSDNLPVSREVAQQVRQEAAASKAQLCEKAKADYDKKIQALSIYKTDSKGTRVYLTAAEMDASRLEARSVRDLACGS
jgi:hypothetical protein